MKLRKLSCPERELVIVLLILGLVSATLCCSGWNKSKPCFCECEDAKADCIKRTVPALEIPLDDLIGKISTDFCDMNMYVGCSSGKTYWSNVRYAQDQKIEKPPGVPSGTLKVKRLKNILE
jgi:hypothetical protein